MTPPAMTSAGRSATARPVRAGRSADAPRAAGATPRPVRAGSLQARTNGVAATRAGAAPARTAPAAARVAVPRPARGTGTHAPRPARSTLTRVPRRVSGPVNPTRPAARKPLPRRVGLAAVEFFRTLPDHRLIDRLVRGRAWIPVLGLLLAGIVATQVEVLKLGASMGRWVERSAALTSHNQALQASVATLSDDQRIERRAAQMGMVMPAATAITFLPERSGQEVRGALAAMRGPDPTQFLATLQAQASTTTSSLGPGPAPAGAAASVSASTGTTSAGASTAAISTSASTSQSTGG